MIITLNNGDTIKASKIYFNSNSIDVWYIDNKTTIEFDRINSIEYTDY
jgi:hypothetical protein